MAGKKQLLQVFFAVAFGFFTTKILIYIVSDQGHRRGSFLFDQAHTDLSSIKVDGPKWAPFIPDIPHKLVVLTYQRCGSSFFGQLFNKNPAVFYTYEPLDALYSSLYGVREGWNVPSDITTFWNGTERKIPNAEVLAVGQFLVNQLSCDVDLLPTESLIHRFWFLFSSFHESLRDYTKCLNKNRLKYTRCSEYTPGFCGGRFGQMDATRMEECRIMLKDEQARELSNHKDFANNMTKYRNCMDQMRTQVDKHCTKLFQTNCNKAKLRTAKTVRATMASMDGILESDPNTRIIHLIRDPRAVVLSRRNFDASGRSRYAGSDLVREAEIYCRDVVRDIKHKQILEQHYPGRIMTIIYDDLTKKPLEYASNIYEFLNTTLHEKTVKWLVQNTQDKKNSTQIASKWQSKLTYLLTKQITEKCVRFMELVNYDFS